jgi:hypothetical protein
MTTEIKIEWIYSHSKKMISLIERYQESSGEKRISLRKKIEKEISLQKALLGKQEDLKKELGIIDADEEQHKKNMANLQKRNKQAPIDIVCD